MTIAAPRGDGYGRAHNLGEAVRKIEQRLDHRGVVKAEARATLIVSEKLASGEALPGPVPLAEECCWQVLEINLTGKLDQLVGGKGRFADVAELESYREELRASLGPMLYALARRVVRLPANATIRAPKAPTRKRTTRELLDLPIVVVER